MFPSKKDVVIETQALGKTYKGVQALITPIGLLVAGPLTDAFGVQIWFVIGGVITGLLGLGGFFVPAIVHFEEGKSPSVKDVQQVSGDVSLG